jgi:hypothetical protein
LTVVALADSVIGLPSRNIVGYLANGLNKAMRYYQFMEADSSASTPMGPRVISEPTASVRCGKLVSDIIQAASPKKPDRKKIMKLVLQLLKTAMASGRESPTFKTALANLESLQIAFSDKVPELHSIDLSIFS